MNPSTKQKQNHRHGKQTCGCQGEEGGEGWFGSVELADTNIQRMDKQHGPTVYTRNHIQYHLRNYNGKEYEKSMYNWITLL